MQPVTATLTPLGEDRLTSNGGIISYSLLTDEQLIGERDRLRVQLDELTMNPGSSAVVPQILVNMEQEIERMTDELRQRVISRHPSSGISKLRGLRSMPWPPPHTE